MDKSQKLGIAAVALGLISAVVEGLSLMAAIDESKEEFRDEMKEFKKEIRSSEKHRV